MANLIHLMLSNYNEMLEVTKDPTVDSWPLMGSAAPMLCIVVLYLSFVLKVGPKMMAKRPAFQLNNIMIAYNAFQVLFSVWLTSQIMNVNIGKLFVPSSCSASNKTPESASVQSSLSNAAWWYFIAKITELLDTVMFVLRKKNNQVSFLHVYHHTITTVFSWCYLKVFPGEQGVLLGFLNSLVHVVMYSYYLIAALGPNYRKYLWWKKYMTWIQLVQFLLMFGYLAMVLAMDCRTPKSLTYFLMTNVVIFMYLFGDFYRKAYKKKEV